jgi:hypothetical protein
VDNVQFSFDVRERLTNISSMLFGYGLFYDGAVVNNSSQNYNGNINGIQAAYNFDPVRVINVPDNFYAPTQYGYHYDNLNRLIGADAETSIFNPYNPTPLYAGDPSELGDVNFSYDKVGNFTILSRGNVYEDSNDMLHFGMTNYLYFKVAGTNRLDHINISGLKPIGCENVSSFNYSYDSNGNLTQDTKRGVSAVTYGRANLPYFVGMSATCEKPEQVAGVDYLYDTGDARIFKGGGSSKEYYQRDAAGHELFVYDKDAGEVAIWYVYGNERVAKIGKRPPLDDQGTCRPKPACDAGTVLLQQQFLQNLNYITSTGAIDYPAKLYRLRLCNGFEPHLLTTELNGLPGNYTILQQIDITSPDQQFSIWQTGGLTVNNLAHVLSLRIGYDQFLLNGYASCAGTPCPTSIIPCEPESASSQNASIAALQAQYANLTPGNLILPARLVRIRLCDGSETYILQEMLPLVEGNVIVLQQIEITSTDQTFSVVINGGPAEEQSLEQVLLYLLRTDRLVDIDGYQPCVNSQPCDISLPECTFEMSEAQFAAIPTLMQVFQQAATGSFDYPTKLYRIRLCNGDEFYVFKEELIYIPGNFINLQEITVFESTQYFELQVDDGSTITTVNGDLEDLLDYRRGSTKGVLYSIDGYKPCGELSPCHPNSPGCSPEERAEQQASKAALLHQMQQLDPNTVQFPARLFLVRFCDESTLYVLEQELNYIVGSYAVIQVVDLTTGLAETFSIIDESGTSLTVSLAELLLYRIEQPGLGWTVRDFEDTGRGSRAFQFMVVISDQCQHGGRYGFYPFHHVKHTQSRGQL